MADEKEQMTFHEAMELEHPAFLSTCYVSVTGKNFVLNLGGGMWAVSRFVDILDKESIEGAIKIDRQFSCNADVDIGGEQLLPFLQKYYPKEYEMAKDKIQPDEVYRITSFDIS